MTGSVKVMISSFQTAEGKAVDGTGEDNVVGCTGSLQHLVLVTTVNTINNHTLKRFAIK